MTKQFIRALRMRIYPNKGQQAKIDKTINCCRFVWNEMLARQNKVYERRGEHLSNYDMQYLLPKMKQYLPWLEEADSQALKYECKKLHDAFQMFFKKKRGYPEFHSKRNAKKSYTNPHGERCEYTNGKVKLPCLGWMTCSDDRELNGKICGVHVYKKNDKYYCSLVYKFEKEVEPTCGTNAIGLDYSSAHFYVDSEGHAADMPHWYRLSEKRLAKAERELSKKHGSKKGEKKSCAFRKQQRKIANIHERVSNQRRDFLHKESTRLADMYDTVCIEDLNMRAQANKGFGNGKATMDNGWGVFKYMLSYKLEERGKNLSIIDKWFPSSQTCNVCGAVNPRTKDLSVRKWTCECCGMEHDRDWNAAVNIRNVGVRNLAYG